MCVIEILEVTFFVATIGKYYKSAFYCMNLNSHNAAMVMLD